MRRNTHCTIIGSGIGGSVAARLLSKKFEVTVLEAGPRHGIRYPDFVETNRKLAEINTFCHAAGGGTNLWHNGLLPMRPEDIQSPEFRAVIADAQSYTDQVARILHFQGESYLAEFADLQDEVDQIGARVGDFEDGTDCLVYPKVYGPLPIPDFVDARFDVSDIKYELAGDRITSVSFLADGIRHSIGTDIVVICAGSLGTPLVLGTLLEQCAFEGDIAGHGLVDHPMGFVGKYRFPKHIAEHVQDFALLDKGTYESRNVIRLRSDCGNYTACAFFRPVLTARNDLKIYKYKSLLGASTGRRRIQNAFSPYILHPDIISEIVSHVAGYQIPTRTYSVLLIGEQRRGGNKAHYEDRRLHVDWSISDEELDIYSKMVSKLDSALRDVAERSDMTFDLTNDWLWSAAHHSGTTSMGTDPARIVDTNLKVRCTDNAYVCDASVIQEHSYANTGLTIAQLAARLAASLN